MWGWSTDSGRGPVVLSQGRRARELLVLCEPDESQRHLKLTRSVLDRMGELLLGRADAIGDRVLVDAESLCGAPRTEVFIEVDPQCRGEARRSIVVGREGT